MIGKNTFKRKYMQVRLDAVYVKGFVVKKLDHFILELEKLEEDYYTQYNGKINPQTNQRFQTRKELIDFALTDSYRKLKYGELVEQINIIMKYKTVCEICTKYGSGNERLITLDFNDLEFLGMLDDTE